MFKKRTILIAGVVVVVLWLTVFLVIEAQSRQSLPKNSYLNSDIQVKTYKGNNGWGYDVYVDGALLIHQPHIPAVSGNSGFITEAHAQKTVELVANKIRKNILPPSVTAQELKDIGIVTK